MDSGRILGITAKRNRNRLLIVTLRTSQKYYVDQESLVDYKISLGNLFYFELDNGNPTKFDKISVSEVLGHGVSLVPNDRFMVIDNIQGTLGEFGDSGKFYFNVKLLGKCAYLGNDEDIKHNGKPRIGQSCKLKLRLLVEDEKIGFFTQLTWGCEVRLQDEEVSRVLKMEQKADREMIGIVVSKHDSTKLVWTKDVFPGNLGTIGSQYSNDIPVGTWINMKFSVKEYQTYFPPDFQNINNPKFKTTNLEVVKPTYPTKSINNGSNVEITIPSLETRSDHNAGNELDDPILGIIGDFEKLVDQGPGKYEIVISKSIPKTTNRGNTSVWKVVRATKKTSQTRGRSSGRALTRTASRSKSSMRKSGKSAERKKSGIVWGDDMGVSLKQEKIISSRISNDHDVMDDVVLNMDHLNISERDINNRNGGSLQNSVDNTRPRPGMEEPVIRNALSVDPYTKRAIIYDVRKHEGNPKKIKCSLWLIDHQKKSVYYADANRKHLKPGYIFEGQFKDGKERGSFECVMDDKPLSLEGVKAVDCGPYVEASIERAHFDEKRLVVSHQFFGEISNEAKKIPLEKYRSGNDVLSIGIVFALKRDQWILHRVLSPQVIKL